MEDKRALQSFGSMKKEKYKIHGSQMIISEENLGPSHSSRINYIVNGERFYRKRARSQELCKPGNKQSKEKRKGELLENVIIEINNTEEIKQRDAVTTALKPKSRWSVLRSVLRAIALFRTSQTETINNEEDLDQALEGYIERRGRANSLVHYKKTEFDRHLSDERFYELIAKGLPEDIQELDTILYNDRRMYLYNAIDSESLVNAKNSMGLTPLYVATQNGNIGMVKYLISKGAIR